MLSIQKLKRLVRYVIHDPRLVWHFNFQDLGHDIDTFVDTDFAGCLRTRLSTSGGAIVRGSHLLQAWSAAQNTVAPSSGEAELSGICRGASKGIGLRSISKDLGIDFNLRVLTDATAAIGICRRRGLGRVRHLAVADLWVQDKMKSKEFELLKVAGKDNPADMVTKRLDQPTMIKHLHALGLHLEKGRAESAPALTHAVITLEDYPTWHTWPIFGRRRYVRS